MFHSKFEPLVNYAKTAQGKSAVENIELFLNCQLLLKFELEINLSISFKQKLKVNRKEPRGSEPAMLLVALALGVVRVEKAGSWSGSGSSKKRF